MSFVDNGFWAGSGERDQSRIERFQAQMIQSNELLYQMLLDFQMTKRARTNALAAMKSVAQKLRSRTRPELPREPGRATPIALAKDDSWYNWQKQRGLTGTERVRKN